MRLENKKVDEGVEEAKEQMGEEEGSVEPPLPPHLLIGGAGDGCFEEGVQVRGRGVLYR